MKYILLAVVFLTGCSSLQQIGSIDVPYVGNVNVGHAAKTVGVHGPVANIQVSVGDIRPGQDGRGARDTALDLNGTAILSALGIDANHNEFYLKDPVVWTAKHPDILEITPNTGRIVTIKGMRRGYTEIYVEAEGVRTRVEFLSVR